MQSLQTHLASPQPIDFFIGDGEDFAPLYMGETRAAQAPSMDEAVESLSLLIRKHCLSMQAWG